jgi:hypothetical protein
MDKTVAATLFALPPSEFSWFLVYEFFRCTLAGLVAYRIYIDTSYSRHQTGVTQ